jgi:thiol-disulfide isomerase/thioredoxin
MKQINMSKKIILSAVAILILCSAFVSSDGTKIPDVVLKNLDGSKVRSSTFTNNGKPLIVSFWATWCVPCKKELDAISSKYADWQKETGVKLIAISIDDERSAAKVVSSVKAKAWPYEIFLDDQANFKNAMKVENVPYTFLVDGNGTVVWTHNSYTAGDEDLLFENVQALVKGEKLKH